MLSADLAEHGQIASSHSLRKRQVRLEDRLVLELVEYRPLRDIAHEELHYDCQLLYLDSEAQSCVSGSLSDGLSETHKRF